jgi:Putative ABC exporter
VNRALWLLLGLQLRGWLRVGTRSLGTVKGALLAMVGLGVFALWLGSLFLTERTPACTREKILEYGPVGLLIYCLLNVVSTSGERAVYFSPGEVNFLFPAPFGRRELLAYKVALSFVFSLPTTLFTTFVFQIYAHSFTAAFVGLLLTFQFMQLFVIIVNLAASAVGARLFTVGRRAAAVVLILLAGAVAWRVGLTPGRGAATEWLREAVHTDVWLAVSQPLRYFFDAFLSENLWPDLAWNGLLALLVDVALLGVVFGMDAQYMEASVSASARIYARIQRMRRVGPSAARDGWAVFSLPMAPFWGGAGPIFWRQMTTASRGAGRLLLAAATFTIVLTAVWTFAEHDNEMAAFGVLVSVAAVLMALLTVLAPFDFRGDVDQIALLKTLPAPAWRLALGQVLTPVLIFTLIQWTALAVVQWVAERPAPLLLAAAAFAPVYNFLLFSVENLLFLVFPTRIVATTPADLQAMGRNVLSQFAKMVGMGGAGVTAAVAGVLVYFLTGFNMWAAATAAWLAAALFAAALVPLMGLAFRAYDVSRDAPP